MQGYSDVLGLNHDTYRGLQHRLYRHATWLTMQEYVHHVQYSLVHACLEHTIQLGDGAAIRLCFPLSLSATVLTVLLPITC